jgi:lipopolysaccharide transport system ATP-binding protein
MMKNAIEIKGLSKYYRLGEYSSKTFAEGIKRWFKRSKNIEISENDRATAAGNSTHVWALKDLDINISKGEVVAVIGKNGAGKSTLLKLLSRITSPSEGSIGISGRIGALLEVGTGFQPDLTGRENVYLNGAILGMTKKEINEKIDAIVDFSGCAKFIDTPVKRYSSGMTVRLGFSIAAHLEPEILIIDEVLAVGDQDFQDQCVKKMKDFAAKGKTVLFVSHNMASVKALCQRGIVLEKGSLSFDGEIDEAIQYYLKNQEKGGVDGLVADGLGTINTQDCVFKRILVTGATKGNVNRIMYGEDMKIEMEIHSEKDQAINIEFLLNTSENYPIGVLNNVFANESIEVTKGLNKYSLCVDLPMVPGNYSLTPAIAQTNGTTLHYLPNLIDFKVEVVPLEKSNPYPFVWFNGSVKFKSNWKKE